MIVYDLGLFYQLKRYSIDSDNILQYQWMGDTMRLFFCCMT
jgi:hypothetical protein